MFIQFILYRKGLVSSRGRFLGGFLGENLFGEKVLPKPLSKTFLDGDSRFVGLI